MQNIQGIETLLELTGQVVQQEHGYWVEIHAWRVEATPAVPHGIRYALTLHEPGGKRVMGYDNAHAAKPSGGFKYAGQVLPYEAISTATFQTKARRTNSRMLTDCCKIFSRMWIEY